MHMSQQQLSWAIGVMACLAGTAAAAPAPSSWSPIVDGIHGRLIVTPILDAKQHPQLRIELELENTSDVANPIPISWGAYGQMLQLVLEDEHGKVIPQNGIGGNELSFAPVALQLPVASTLRVTISTAALEYVPGGTTMLRPVSLQAWNLPAKPTKLFLRAKFVPAMPSATSDRRAFKGPLELPRVALP
jgi:hypothetical protein